MRVAIVGNSGSGKSTLARSLAAGHRADTLDLDTIAWEPGKIAVARDSRAAIDDLRRFCDAREHWIVEGCYGSLIEATLDYRPELVLIDPGLEQCLANCRARPWEPHKYASKQEQDSKLAFLLQWVADYYTRDGDLSLTGHNSLYDRYTGPKRRVTGLPGTPRGFGEPGIG